MQCDTKTEWSIMCYGKKHEETISSRVEQGKSCKEKNTIVKF